MQRNPQIAPLTYRPQSKAEPLKLPPLQNQSLTQRYSLKRFPTIDKWMSRPEFSAVTEGDQNDFTTRTWSPVGHSTVLEGGIQYPNLFRERGNKLSWSRILKDAGQSVDGYRKIHAAKKKRESLDVSCQFTFREVLLIIVTIVEFKSGFEDRTKGWQASQ